MNKKLKLFSTALGAAILAAAATSHAAIKPFVIDPGYYEYPSGGDYGGSTIGFNGIEHGSVVSNDTGTPKTFFHDIIPGELDVDISWGSGDSWGNAHQHDPETASNGFTVAFDTHREKTEDPDLEDPFRKPNSTQTWSKSEDADLRRPGNIFFVQEKNNSNTLSDCVSDGVCDEDGISGNNIGPDDDAQGQWTWIDFSMDVTIEEMAVFDIDGCGCSGNEWAYVGFFSEVDKNRYDNLAGGDRFTYSLNGNDDRYYEKLYGQQIGHFGNHAAKRVAFDDGQGGAGVSGVSGMLVDFSSSGGFDQIKGYKETDDPQQPPGVPEPLTASLLALGLVGAARARRRRAHKV